MSYESLSMGQKVTLACMLEVSAPKPGNVHRGADFDDLSFYDFIQSAAVIGPVFEQHEQLGLGELILAAVEATRSVVSTNTNLGLILLMAPLAKASTLDQAGIQAVLSNLNSDDADLTYQAIAKANASRAVKSSTEGHPSSRRVTESTRPGASPWIRHVQRQSRLRGTFS